MLNTFGLRAVNAATFNPVASGTWINTDTRENATLILRLHNLVLNILGYIPGICTASGICRIISGIILIGVTANSGRDRCEHGLTRDELIPWYDEALITGVAQVARGIIEAFVPSGAILNASLDIASTPYNYYVDHTYPEPPDVHPESLYLNVAKILYLV